MEYGDGEQHQVIYIDGVEVQLGLRIPTLCPVCLDDGYCPNKLKCLLECWFCDGGQQLVLFPPSVGAQP